MTLKADPLSWPPRGLSREQAARHVGVSTTKFDEMVADRRMPRPKRIDGRVVWDRIAIEAAFTDLPEDGAGNPLDRMNIIGRATDAEIAADRKKLDEMFGITESPPVLSRRRGRRGRPDGSTE